MGKLDDYEFYYNKYTKIYGKQTVILYQIGKFHELYGIDNDTEKVGNVTEIANLLGIKETRVDTNILENNRQNPQMAGFNSVNIDERVDRLVSNGYTVIVVNQIPGTQPIKREVAYIESPSTRITSASASASETHGDPYLVSIYFDRSYNKEFRQNFSYIGMSAMDTTTGDSWYYESNSSVSDPSLAEDDLTRFLQTFNPIEVVLNRRHKDINEPLIDKVHKWGFRLKDDDIAVKTTVFTDTSEAMTNISYQEEFLGKYFAKRGHLDPSEFLGMAQADVARLSYIYLLDFCANHNAKLLTKLDIPKLWNNDNNMILDNSSIMQLNIIESYYQQGRHETIVSMLAKYIKTTMGKRLLRERLINPIIDITQLESRYNNIETAAGIEHGPFSRIKDIDRLNRKMALLSISPSEFYMLDSSLVQAYAMIESFKCYGSLYEKLSHIPSIRAKYTNIFVMEEVGKYTFTENIQDSIFRKGYNADIDKISSLINVTNKVRDILCQKLSDLIMKGSNYCKYKEDNKGISCYCSLTKAQFKKLEANFPKSGLEFMIDDDRFHILWSDLDIDTRNKSNVKFSIKQLDVLLSKEVDNMIKLKQISIKLFNEIITSLNEEISSEIKSISLAIGEIDLYCGMYKAAKECNYCKPTLIDDKTSSIFVERLRHPIIERHHSYIPQTIMLGDKYNQCGILLYGVNQTGKSCTMKSIGIATIMAQAGLFVACEKMVLSPYKLLTTRIISNDNISKGLSTFAVEMTELRSILTRCNEFSLNLGDEVCHGTESASAVAIVAASIEHMSLKLSSFIFATHLHELSKISEITELENVKHYHLTVDFEGDNIIYNRLMLPGSGLGLYGIEVAKHLRLPFQVLENAYKIRNKYYSTTVKVSDLKKSRYNNKTILSTCRVPNCTNSATETHHIRHQAAGTSIDGMNKNNPDNLVPLCEKHHDMTHGKLNDKILVIHGYSKDGRLDVSYRKIIKSLIKS